MDLRQMLILISGVIGIALVGLCPRWVYTSHPLMPLERGIGYRFISNPPKPVPVFKVENGIKIINTNHVEVITAHIDRGDLSARIVLIVAITVLGLWVLRRHRIENRKKHWILILLATFGLLLAAHIQTAGNTN